MNRRTSTLCSLGCLVMWSAGAAAQEANANAAAPADAPGRLSKAIVWAASRLDGDGASRDGFHPALGGLVSGSGPSIGSGYRLHILGNQAMIDVSAEISTRRYRTAQSTIVWPSIGAGGVSLGAQVSYQDFTAINFFGIGANSLENDQTAIGCATSTSADSPRFP